MKKIIKLPLFLSLLIHLFFLGPILNFNSSTNFPVRKTAPSRILNIREYKTVGIKEAKDPDQVFLKKKKKQVTLSDLNTVPNSRFSKDYHPRKSIKKASILQSLKTSSSPNSSISQALIAFENNDIQIDLQMPKGIPEDELNKKELVFYSFRKRTAIAYVHSFYKELNNFERQNPHLRFPISQNKELMSGQVIYDHNGDILSIKTTRWSHIKPLQDLFVDVLKNMNSLPNPPREIIHNDQFAINFTLEINHH